jgi:hypothetical protein
VNEYKYFTFAVHESLASVCTASSALFRNPLLREAPASQNLYTVGTVATRASRSHVLGFKDFFNFVSSLARLKQRLHHLD